MAIINKLLAQELIRMANIDQEMRLKWINNGAVWDVAVDEANQKRLKQIVAEYSWPTISLVGKRASNAAWLIVQHAPDLKFKEKCLELMERLPLGEVKPANIAYLKDRVLMWNGKPQIYGTQFHGFGKDIKVHEIQDPEHVDKRRANVGLDTFAKNEARLRKINRVKKTK
ncbi:MAG TPA: DUF6624 domain-containing protein [Candidatus Saccharimonadales bacterium]|jgi:hypothetical protein|nr:DUF6624 domain-containing protein [Candidatus Saccharimonadales bacterium]